MQRRRFWRPRLHRVERVPAECRTLPTKVPSHCTCPHGHAQPHSLIQLALRSLRYWILPPSICQPPNARRIGEDRSGADLVAQVMQDHSRATALPPAQSLVHGSACRRGGPCNVTQMATSRYSRRITGRSCRASSMHRKQGDSVTTRRRQRACQTMGRKPVFEGALIIIRLMSASIWGQPYVSRCRGRMFRDVHL